MGGATYGVAKAATLVSVRVLDCNGSGSWSDVIAGVDWIAANRVLPAVANLSLVGAPNASADDALRALVATGVSSVVAAGNGAADACNFSPARVPDVMTIGGTSAGDARAESSNHGDCVDWFAPGESITSASNASATATSTRSGTSLAAPFTAGVVALFLEAQPGASPLAVRDTLFRAATKGVVSSANSMNNHLLFSRVVNRSPMAAFAFSCVVLACTFTDQSTDSDGSVQSVGWTFGDGASSIGVTTSHSYASSGLYTASLTVTDDLGATATTAKMVRVVRVTLTASGYRQKGQGRAELLWSGALAAKVDVWRDGRKLTTVDNTGRYTDVVSAKSGLSYSYKVCEAATSTCSNSAQVTF